MSFKICTVGCGGMAFGGHGPSFRKYAAEREDVLLAGCCDIDSARAERYRTEFGFARAYTDMEEMIRSEKPDAVSLVVPVDLTEPMSVSVLKLGIPVILEKPPGMNREQTLRMIEAAEKSGTPHQVAFNRRYMPLVRRFRELRQGIDARLWQYDFYRVNRCDADFATTSVHAIDTVRFLAGSDYESVEFRYLPDPVRPELVPSILMDCVFKDGQAARITFAPASGISVEQCVMHGTNTLIRASLPYHGQKGSLAENGEILFARDSEILLCEPGEAAESFIENGFYGENAHFFDCIRSGTRPEDDIASGLQAVEIADHIRQRKTDYHSE